MFAEVKGDVVVTWPYNYDTLCQANPSTAFPSNKTLLEMYSGTEANLDGNVLVKVVEQPQPSCDAKTQTVAQAAQPVLSNGEWQLGWVVSTLTTEQQAAAQDRKAASVRVERNQKLKDSDWVVVKHLERNENIPGAWEVYRQALRDVPTQQGFPWNVTWPEEP